MNATKRLVAAVRRRLTADTGFRCPECGVPIEPPRKLFFGPGEHEVVCRNGHRVVLRSRMKS